MEKNYHSSSTICKKSHVDIFKITPTGRSQKRIIKKKHPVFITKMFRWFLITSKQSFWIMDFDKIHIIGCRTNQECLIEDPNKPICGSDGMCIRGLL